MRKGNAAWIVLIGILAIAGFAILNFIRWKMISQQRTVTAKIESSQNMPGPR